MSAWLADQLVRAGNARSCAPDIPRYNPRPAGVIRPGSSTEVVLAMLSKRRVWMNFAQVLAQTGCTKAGADFALRYLLSQKHIEATSDESRNYRYQRYRATEEGIRYAESRF